MHFLEAQFNREKKREREREKRKNKKAITFEPEMSQGAKEVIWWIALSSLSQKKKISDQSMCSCPFNPNSILQHQTTKELFS